MNPQIHHVVHKLGVSGTVFCLGLMLLALFVAFGFGTVAVLTALVMLIPGFILGVRGVRFLRRHSLWSLRNRLLLVYALMGILPVCLFVLLAGFGIWAFISELAVYLAGNALDHYVNNVNDATRVLLNYPPERRLAVAAELYKPFNAGIRNFSLILRDSSGVHCFPSGGFAPQVDAAWPNAHGLLAFDGHFYAWSHLTDGDEQIDSFAPIDNAVMRQLAPNLGEISIFENSSDPDEQHRTAAHAETFEIRSRQDTTKAGLEWDAKQAPGRSLPPPVVRLDIPVFTPAARSHYHLDKPGKTYSGVLVVLSRPSAVFRSLFSGSETVRSTLFGVVIAVGILFLVLEAIAVWIGVSLSRRITRAVNQLYEGTRRVIRGDFRHRIAINDSDQLGDLAQSFNQMTGNIERLMAVEKEKERLQTELEIAREVQNQLYPKAAPPLCGLRLTVRCQPALMVSGDYYDYQDIGSGKVVFAMGDVAGKGISAALLMATIQASLRAQITKYAPTHPNDCSHHSELDAAGLVSRLNRQIYAHTAPEKYATFFFALFEEASRTLTYTNAGHLSPLLFQRDHVKPLDSNGTVVGAFPFAKYDESCLTLEDDDLLVCYTDGITEPENAYGEMFGEERLIDLVKKHRHRDDGELLDIIMEAVRAWTGSPELSDDMTLLLARQVSPAA